MFNLCVNIEGGNKTTFSTSYTGKTYARIDTDETPGYFTRATSTGITENSGTIIRDESHLPASEASTED